MSHESGQLAARVWWINCSLGQICILVTRMFLFPGHPTLHIRGLWEILLEWVNDPVILKVSFSITCIFAPKRKQWPPELTVSGMLEVDHSDSRDHPALRETSSCQAVSKDCTRPDYASPPAAGTRLTRRWGWTGDSGAQEGHMAGFGVRPLGSSPELWLWSSQPPPLSSYPQRGLGG